MKRKHKHSYEAKLQRAYTHLKAFDARWGKFLKGDPYDSPTQEHPHPTDPNLRLIVVHQVRRKRRVIPHQPLALMLGDAFYNMRSALDHLAGAIARKHMATKVRPKDVSFPIHGAESSWKEQGIAAISQMPERAREIIEDLQPWKRITRTDPDAFRADPLFLLNALCNEDKHRHFIFDGAVSTQSTASLGPKCRNVQVAIGTAEVRFGPFDDQTDVIRLLVRILDPDHYVDVNHQIIINPSFPEGSVAGGEVVMQVCADILHHIQTKVIPPLQKFV